MALIDVQIASKEAGIPSAEQMRLWCESSLSPEYSESEIALRIVDDAEMLELNSQFRQKEATTNVLSFPAELPYELPPELELNELGDIVICASVVKNEAEAQGKMAEAHWAHMVVHGTLHLQGYDHIDAKDADEMEALEDQIITGLGFPAPYSV